MHHRKGNNLEFMQCDIMPQGITHNEITMTYEPCRGNKNQTWCPGKLTNKNCFYLTADTANATSKQMHREVRRLNRQKYPIPICGVDVRITRRTPTP